jgi:hypothetical protein
MSHIVTIKTEIRDPAALAAACTRLKLEQPTTGTVKLFSTEATGLIVKLPDWTYPVVVNPTTGQIDYDNYGGAWGADVELHKLLQAYAVEKARIEARKRGYTVTEQSLPDGSIQLKVQLGGGIGGAA